MKKSFSISFFFLVFSCFIVISDFTAETLVSAAMARKCPSCGKIYSDETKFCGEDGTQLVDMPVKMVCPECGKEGAQGDKFCKEHGIKLIPKTETALPGETDVVKQKKELAVKYYKAGSEYCDTESYDRALESYKKAEEAYPDFPELHYNMGWLYGKLGDARQAIEHLQRYIILSPKSSDITEVQSYIVLLKQLLEKQQNIRNTINNRDEVMKRAVILQKQKHKSVIVPAGEFVMGTDNAREDAYPEHKVYLEAFEIDCYEVTNAQYWEFLDYMKKTNDHSKCFKGEPSNKDHTPRFWDNEYYNVPEYPVARVDWFDAYAYAAWAGKRLPTEAEWEKAARGSDGRNFPWGNDWDPARCNLSGEPKPVGSVSTGKSVYGCYDMAGSVYEWCADWYLDSYYAETPYKNPTGPEKGMRRVIRGGSRFSKPFQVRAHTRKSEQPDLFNLALGFRCANDASGK